MKPHKPLSLMWTPNKTMLALALLFLPLLLALGTWQLGRAEQKRLLEAQMEQRQSRAPVALATLQTPEPYTPVMVVGEYDNQHVWLLDNRQRDGRPGYEVVQAFIPESGQRVLINRGWLAAGPQRSQLPDVPRVQGHTTIFAEVAEVSDHPLLSASSEQHSWPRIITQIEPAVMAEQIGEPLAAFYLRLDASSSSALRTGWARLNMSSAKHSGYAAQWFAMAFALAVLTLFANSNLGEVLRQRRAMKGRAE